MRAPSALAAVLLALAGCATAGPRNDRPPVPPDVPAEWLHFSDTSLAEGSTAPDFTLFTPDGSSSVTLSSLRGRPVVLVFGSHT